MKTKILVLVTIISLLVTGVVSAASIWGSYKGKDIIRITLNGQTVHSSDVPAISFDGRTMIPISMLSKIGIQYTWDQKTKTVNIISNTNISSNQTVAPVKIVYPLLYSNDLKVYLGRLTTNIYDSESIFNEYGTYGSKYQSKSIWNEYGTYGSEYSDESAFNDLATKPPAIVINGKISGHLTTNENISDGVNITTLIDLLKENGF